MAAGRPPAGGSLNRQRESLPTSVESLPELDPAYDAALEPALDALAAIGSPIPELARRQVADHVRLLLAWNAAINLTTIVDPAALARRHVADSLAALPVVRAGPAAAILDLGSGAGFPGMPLAAAVTTARVTLVDSTTKKARFLEVVAAAIGLAAATGTVGAPDGSVATAADGAPGSGRGDRVATSPPPGRVIVMNARAESLPGGAWDLVVARAVAPLDRLVELALPLLRIGGRLVAWKRGDPHGTLGAELAAGEAAARALGGSAPAWVPHPPGVAAAARLEGHGIALMTKVRPAAIRPRADTGVRRRRWRQPS